MFLFHTVVLSCFAYLDKYNFLASFVLSPAFCISVALSLLNSQKVVEGDLIAYLAYFRELESLSLIEVLLLYVREPVFYIQS